MILSNNPYVWYRGAKTVEEDLEIDKKTRTVFWDEAIAKEMK